MLLTAFLITLFIFAAGTYVGFLLDGFRISQSQQLVEDVDLDTQSYIIESKFFDTFGANDCNLLAQRMQLLGDNLGELGRTLARYDAKKLSKGKEYQTLRRKYFLFEIQAYTLRKQMSELCPKDKSNVILFFYNSEDNQDSLNQGYVLDTIVKSRKDLVVFSIDRDFNESVIFTLFKYYNLTQAPSIVINFDNKFEGYTPEWVINSKLKG